MKSLRTMNSSFIEGRSSPESARGHANSSWLGQVMAAPVVKRLRRRGRNGKTKVSLVVFYGKYTLFCEQQRKFCHLLLGKGLNSRVCGINQGISSRQREEISTLGRKKGKHVIISSSSKTTLRFGDSSLTQPHRHVLV